MVKEVDLLSYLPPHLRKLKEFREIAKAETPEIILILEAIDKYLRNMFIETADEDGISVFEGLLGLFPSEDESLESRRLRVALRWNNKNLRLNERLISLCGKDGYKLIKDLKNYRLRVETTLTDGSIFSEVIEILEKMLPANLIITYTNKTSVTSPLRYKIGAVGSVVETIKVGVERTYTVNNTIGINAGGVGRVMEHIQVIGG